MYKRFWTICVVIGAALLTLSIMGVSSLNMHERGLRAERQGQFVAVAEQIRFDVKGKLDGFLQTEWRRPYTDYQYAYIPETTNQVDALVRSPLADSLTHGLAFGHFQIDAAGGIVTPYRQEVPSKIPDTVLAAYMNTLKTQVLDALKGQGSLTVRRIESARPAAQPEQEYMRAVGGAGQLTRDQSARQEIAESMQQIPQRSAPRTQTYRIESLEENTQTQMMQQSRETAMQNVAIGANEDAKQEALKKGVESPIRSRRSQPISTDTPATPGMAMDMALSEPATEDRGAAATVAAADKSSEGTVQIRIEPFVPLIVPEGPDPETVFPGQIFLLRHVQIETTHLLQGFRLNETELARQVRLSSDRLVREGMGVELSQTARPDAAYTAILDFGFGELVLNLFEQDPGWIAAKVERLNRWLTAILAVVWLAVVLAMVGLWRNLREQIILARKKDDFISAVSHELRTPLTSIRMYTEMLEKDWVKDEGKRREYYATMRQESERLTRLIENVLDFSRIQRGKKQFEFRMGDINESISDVIEMMRPCAERAGFTIEKELAQIDAFAFDRDAVMQIVINLLDNALKYAKEASDKRIIVRTRSEHGCAVIEVEDHGPGIPKSQQKRIFEAFYRCGDEATRQTTGTGLGLALVKRFAEAHRGVVEVLTARPKGTIFRVRVAR